MTLEEAAKEILALQREIREIRQEKETLEFALRDLIHKEAIRITFLEGKLSHLEG